MKKHLFKKGLSVFMAAVMCLTTFVSTVFASGEESEVFLVSFPREEDPAYSGDWGHKDSQYMNGWHFGASKFTSVRALNSYEGGICYCIEPGVTQNPGDKLAKKDENFWDNYPAEYNKTIKPEDIKLFIGRIMQYGYTGNVSLSWRSNNDGGDKLSHAVATQILIWETVVGERDANFNKVGTGGKDAVLSQISTNHPLYSKIMGYYNSIESSVKKQSMLPSFMAKSADKAQSFELEWDGEKYIAVLTDTNGVVENFSFSAGNPTVKLSVSGNKLTVTDDTAPSGSVSITATAKNAKRRGIITWTDGSIGPDSSIQDVVTFTQPVSDSVKGYFNVKVSYGSAKIVKTSEDGKVDGIRFNISGNGINQDVVTNLNGEIIIDNLVPGVYTVTEQNYDKYEPQETRRVTVVSGQTATISFSNVLKRGDLTVTKTSEDGLNEGVKFHLYGTSVSGDAVDEYAVTNADGIARFEDVLVGSGYTLEEVDTDNRYVIPDGQTANIEWNKVTNKSFENILKKWNATVTKSDKETGAEQGNASLAGAVYGVYKGSELVDKYTTDENGQFTTKYYTCGNDWTIREIAPSEGYLLDNTDYHVGAEAELYTVEYNSVAMDVTEQVAKGDIAIIKHTDNGDTQIETPEAGATFEVYLKSAGSFENAKETERDVLTCDENGFAQTKKLPYGVYTVHQTSGWEGRDMIDDFDVFVSADGQTYRYLINNANFESYLKIVKADAETGKTIPYAGAGFQIFRPDGSKVEMTFTYPEVTKVDTFYTNDKGFLITPEKLEYGEGYYLKEVQAPYGYVLNSDPVYFDITPDNAEDENSVTVIKVTKPDMAQKGIIKISKTGEVFSKVVEADGVYQPVFEVKGLPGAEFEIIAAEDIYTPDGTLRAKKGEVVDIVTTDKNGAAESKALYLGKYEVKETKAPNGMILNKETYVAELVYAGQEIEITETKAELFNDRQKAEISLDKIMEQNDKFGIGMNGEVTNVVFGLYADEDILAADGTVIPKDGLIERVYVDENGHAVCKTDLPFGSYYLKEIDTDSHYLLPDTKYPFTFEYAGQDTAKVEIKANDSKPIENEILYGEVFGTKKDDNGKVLGGAVIGIFKADCTEFTAENALMTVTSADDGSFYFEDVPYGNWIVKEIEAPTGYVLFDKVFNVTVDNDTLVIEIEIENTIIRGNVQLTKVDKDYPENKLTGADFTVYRDSDGDKKLTEADEEIGKLTEIDKGVYEMKDLTFGGYFVKETKAPDGFRLDNNTYYFEINENGKTVIVENEAGKGFINEAQTGAIKIIKSSSDGKVEGFSFRVTGPNGYNQVFTTDKNGEIIIEGLRVGKYVVSEISDSVSAGYILPDEEFVTVIDGTTSEVNMFNQLNELPNTGDPTNSALWLMLTTVSAASVAFLGTLGFKRKKKENEI